MSKADCRGSHSARRGLFIAQLDYYRHRKRVRLQDGGADQLVRVELIDPAAAVGGLRVELANGRRIVVEADSMRRI